MSAFSPESTLPLLPLRSGVLLPESSLTLTVGRERSVALVKSVRPGDVFALVTQRDAKVEDPVAADFHAVGVLARLVSVHRPTGGEGLRITVEGVARFAVDRVTSYEPFLRAEGHVLQDQRGDSAEAKVLVEEIAVALRELGGKSGQFDEVERLE